MSAFVVRVGCGEAYDTEIIEAHVGEMRRVGAVPHGKDVGYVGLEVLVDLDMSLRGELDTCSLEAAVSCI